jgi:hypothetical protein
MAMAGGGAVDERDERAVAYREALRRKERDPRWDGRYAVEGPHGHIVVYQLHPDGTARPCGPTFSPDGEGHTRDATEG